MKFIDHARAKYPTDIRFSTARSKWTGKILFFRALSSEYQVALGVYNQGTILINADILKNPAKSTGSIPNEHPSLIYLLLHELAHTNGSGHNDVWLDAFVAFLKVARDDLKWGCSEQCVKLIAKRGK